MSFRVKLKSLIAVSALCVAGMAISSVGLPLSSQMTISEASARDYGDKYRHRNVAGQFAYYDLVLSWSPTYCETGGFKRRDPQCTSNRPYGFVLHGLWPQHKKGWPQSCRLKKNPWVSREVIRSMLDIMPSKGLIIHEYKKHGTCTGLTPEGYYKLSRKLYNKIKIPPRYTNLQKPLLISPKQIEDDFLIANPELKPEMISIACGKRRLREIRICFGRSGKLIPCGQNENQQRLCRQPKVYMPPVR